MWLSNPLYTLTASHCSNLQSDYFISVCESAARMTNTKYSITLNSNAVLLYYFCITALLFSDTSIMMFVQVLIAVNLALCLCVSIARCVAVWQFGFITEQLYLYLTRRKCDYLLIAEISIQYELGSFFSYIIIHIIWFRVQFGIQHFISSNSVY